MRKSVILVMVSVVFFSFALAGQETYYDDSYARLSYISGDTYVQRAQDLGLEAGTVNLAVISGDRLGTRDGRLEIHLSRQNYLRMDRHSRIEVIQLPERGRNLVKLAFESGEIYLRVSFLGQDQEIEVHTADASFYVLEEGLYRLRTDESRETELRVLEGSMEAAGEEASEVVRTEERLVASDGRFIFGPTRLHSQTSDDFSDWNRMRESFLTRAVSNSYLPSELSSYEAELDYYGHWTYERPYGYVWVPHVVHDTWRPYYNGRWVWYPIIGYTWVSYDPWGWCVSHYGRWHWRFGLGWYWIPRRGWGPGWVHWYHGAHHYGWCPLSYHGYPGVIINNRYYGNGYYRDYPVTSRALVMVHKRQLQAPNISRVALSRNQIQGVDRVRLSSRQPAERPATGGARLDGRARITPKSPIRTYSRSSAAGNSSAARTRAGTIRSGRSSSSTARVRSGGDGSGRQSRSDSVTIRGGNARSSIKSYPSQRSGTATRSVRDSGGSSSRSRSATADRSIRDRTSSTRGSVRTYSSRALSRSGQASRSSTRSGSTRSAGSSSTRTYPSSSRARSVSGSSQVRTYPSSGRERTVRSSSQSRSSIPSSRAAPRTSSARSTTRNTRSYPSTQRSSARTQSRVSSVRSSRASRGNSVIRSNPPSRAPSSSAVRSSRSSSSRSSVSRGSSPSRSSRSSVSRSSAPARSSRSVGRSSSSSSSSSSRRSAGRSSSSARSSGSRVRKR